MGGDIKKRAETYLRYRSQCRKLPPNNTTVTSADIDIKGAINTGI